jgi:hypothetical protein
MLRRKYQPHLARLAASFPHDVGNSPRLALSHADKSPSWAIAGYSSAEGHGAKEQDGCHGWPSGQLSMSKSY